MTFHDGPLAHAAGVTRRFGAFTAVDNASIRIERGEIVGLLGANGAGKTTLIRMLLGLVAPTSGRIRLFGKPPSRHTRQQLGYVPQGLGLYPDLTVKENLAFVTDAFGRKRLPPLPEDLRGTEQHLVRTIGLGLQRQLAFVAALAHQPRLLVLDEPTSGVDPLGRDRLWDVVHEQAENGVGVLITTHYMQEAQQCDRLVLMAQGKQVAAGSEHDIIGSTTAVQVHTHSWAHAFEVLNNNDVPATLAGRDVRVANTHPGYVAAILDRAGIEAHISEVPATLEEKMTIISPQSRPVTGMAMTSRA